MVRLFYIDIFLLWAPAGLAGTRTSLFHSSHAVYALWLHNSIVSQPYAERPFSPMLISMMNGRVVQSENMGILGRLLR